MWKSKNTVHLSRKLQRGVGRGYSKHTILKLGGTFASLLTLALVMYTLTHLRNGDTTKPATPQVLGDSINTITTATTSEFTIYKVQAGDTLFNISQRLNLSVSWTTLAEINNLKPPFSLKPGQQIKVPNKK